MARRPLDRLELGALLAVGLVLAGVAAVPLVPSFAVSPERIESGEVRLTRPCPHEARTGEACPTCGMTRAFAAASHGRPALAWRYHRAALPLYALTWVTFLGGAGATGIAARGLWRLRRGGQGGVH